jgi:hypothetical protein
LAHHQAKFRRAMHVGHNCCIGPTVEKGYCLGVSGEQRRRVDYVSVEREKEGRCTWRDHAFVYLCTLLKLEEPDVNERPVTVLYRVYHLSTQLPVQTRTRTPLTGTCPNLNSRDRYLRSRHIYLGSRDHPHHRLSDERRAQPSLMSTMSTFEHRLADVCTLV